MSQEKMMRLSQAARKLNVGISTIVDHLSEKGYEVESSPNAKISGEQYDILTKEFQKSLMDKEEASGLTIGNKHTRNMVIKSDQTVNKSEKSEDEEIMIKNLGTSGAEEEEKEPAKESKEEKEEDDTYRSDAKLQGIKVVGKIDLDKGKAKPKKEEPKKEEPKKEELKKEEPKKEEPKKEPEVKKQPEPKKEEPKKEEVKAKEEPKKEEKPAEKKEEAEKVPEGKKKDEDGNIIEARADSLKGLTVLGKIELPKKKEKEKKPVASSDAEAAGGRKRKRKRLRVDKPAADRRKVGGKKGGKRDEKEEVSQKEIQEKINNTLAKLGGTSKSSGNRARYRREKRSAMAEAREEQEMQQQEEAKKLKVTEFISANDLASMMDVHVNEVISMCMNLGMFVSINQRLDAETITIIADEFGYEVDFKSSDDEEEVIVEEEDNPEDLKDRAPIVTIMGHVDHGKTSLLDFIRDSKIADKEAGGITQHVGAYKVTTESGKDIAFLDTPGHEAFTAMRARGAKVTDIVILVVAADDRVMPQTKEAINHAQVAGVPIVIAINKVDKPQANPDKIREELSKENILVEEWGGKYQCQEVSAKSGIGIDDLLEKVLLEAEVQELKANPSKHAAGTVIEATLDKGRGYLTNVLIQAGTLKVGDIVLAGAHHGRVKAMTDHLGKRLEEAGPSTPVQVLGLDGAPQAGDRFNVVETEREAREVTTKRAQILREQNIRTKKHITLDEIGRRLAIGTFKELNVIVKGDVDGSVEALSDSLLKLSTEEIQVNIIHKGVGQITESDVLLASAADAIIIGFQVRPSGGARGLAENEEIEIRTYSVIYKAIEEMKDALEGMLEPTVEESITGTAEVREVFKISKVGTVAGCMVQEGHIKRNANIRIIREGVVVHSGQISALKRFKEDVAEVKFGYECGISIKNYNDIKESDIIEAFEEKEVKRKL